MKVQNLIFEKVDAPLKLVGVPHLIDMIGRVLPKWPNRVSSTVTESPPFFTISPAERSDRYLCEDHVGRTEPRQLDPVNAVCDMVAAIPRALAESDNTLICLHAAAVAICGRLVVFPNIRRSGKSTLTAALAHSGHAVFSDDVLPISFDKNGRAFGLATGVAPRLRLPLPDRVPQEFRTWTELASCAENKQYRFLNLVKQPQLGEILPIAGFAVLDRQEEQTYARLDRVGADTAMDVLLYQNFTRDRHSADVLKSIAGLLSSQPVLRLTFYDLESAVECLETEYNDQLSEMPTVEPTQFRSFRLAELDTRQTSVDVSVDTIQQRSGTFEQRIGSTLYLADPNGRAIHRMDALSAAIWDTLKEPGSATELQHALQETFPDVASGRIADDVTALLRKLNKANLLEHAQ